MKECLNCGKLFKPARKKQQKNFVFCSKDCYWEYKIIKGKRGKSKQWKKI